MVAREVMILLTADWHLDPNPVNEYRWQIFDHVRLALSQNNISQVFVLGDCVERRDRHTAAFVNRLLEELDGLPITIIRGNHDTTIQPPCYFDWMRGYVSKPTEYNKDLLLLPFTPNPVEDWCGLRLGDYRALFMHVTHPGAL